MPERQAFVDQVKGAERSCYVVAAAVKHYGADVLGGKAELPAETSPRDLVAAADQVESTHLIRMWAAFEMALRSYHEQKTGNDEIRAVNLVDWTTGIKQGRAISKDVRDGVHQVREYRNYLVHGNSAPAVSIKEARRHLNKLLHCLPIQW